jgi:hypothetical protein
MATAAASTFSDIAALIPAGATIIAVTDDGSDPRCAAVRDAATRFAAITGARVLLHYSPPGRQALGARAPRHFVPDMTPDGAGRPHTGSRRRDLLLPEAKAIRARGVDVAVWLAGQPGPAGIAEAVDLTSAAAVLVPAEQDRPGVLNLTLAYRATKIAALVVAVGSDGSISPIRPLCGCRPTVDAQVIVPSRRPAVRLEVAAFVG